MNLVPGPERIRATQDSDPVEGSIVWSPAKSLWIGANNARVLAYIRESAEAAPVQTNL